MVRKERKRLLIHQSKRSLKGATNLRQTQPVAINVAIRIKLNRTGKKKTKEWLQNKKTIKTENRKLIHQ